MKVGNTSCDISQDRNSLDHVSGEVTCSKKKRISEHYRATLVQSVQTNVHLEYCTLYLCRLSYKEPFSINGYTRAAGSLE